MEIVKAFQLERPAIELRWGLREAPFRELFADTRLRQITSGHLRARCKLLGGLEADVDFHFKPRRAGQLFQVELYRRPRRHRQQAFDDWQARLKAMLGPGTERPRRLPIDTSYEWQFGQVAVVHERYYHTGEHERILVTCRAV